MDYRKLDATLRAALSCHETEPGYQYHVFIHTMEPVGDEEQQLLKNSGVSDIRPGKKIFTATLPAESLSALSDQSWVAAIRLSRRMRTVPILPLEDRPDE